MKCDAENYNWNDYFMDIAELTAKRSSVPTTQVGAVLVYDKRTIAQGYNGYPAGHPHWRVVGRDKDKEVHAEANAIAWAARRGTPTEGCTLYTTMMPCMDCAKLIIQAGIVEVIVKNQDISKDFRSGQELLEESDVRVYCYDKRGTET